MSDASDGRAYLLHKAKRKITARAVACTVEPRGGFQNSSFWRSDTTIQRAGRVARISGSVRGAEEQSFAPTRQADVFSRQTLPCCVCRFFWRSDGDYPCVGQHISRRKNARRLSPSDLRTTLPDLRALAKRPLASPHRAANWRRSVDDQPRACSQHRRARLSLQASAREGLAETRRGLGQAAQNDARFGGADRSRNWRKSGEIPVRARRRLGEGSAPPCSVTAAAISMAGKPTASTGHGVPPNLASAATHTAAAHGQVQTGLVLGEITQLVTWWS